MTEPLIDGAGSAAGAPGLVDRARTAGACGLPAVAPAAPSPGRTGRRPAMPTNPPVTRDPDLPMIVDLVVGNGTGFGGRVAHRPQRSLRRRLDTPLTLRPVPAVGLRSGER